MKTSLNIYLVFSAEKFFKTFILLQTSYGRSDFHSSEWWEWNFDISKGNCCNFVAWFCIKFSLKTMNCHIFSWKSKYSYIVTNFCILNGIVVVKNLFLIENIFGLLAFCISNLHIYCSKFDFQLTSLAFSHILSKNSF